MKTITLYECDICQRRYDRACDAQDCEMRGQPTQYPVGCIYGNNTPDAFYKSIVFAVAKNTVQGHCNYTSAWVCRADLAVGDSLGNEHCQGENRMTAYHANVDREMPAFLRMVEWLKSQDIESTIWDGEKAVPLNEEAVNDG